MEKIIQTIGLALLMTAFTQNTTAQIEQGKKIVGASSNLGFSAASNGGSSSSTFLINTSIGFLFTDHLAGGVDFGFASVSVGRNSSDAINIGGFSRYYVDNFYPEISIGIINQSTFGSSTSNIYFGLGVGYAIALNDYISIDPKINYTCIKYDGDNSNGFGIHVGFTLYF